MKISKIVISIIIWMSYFILYKLFYPIITNEQAINQLNNSTESFTNYQMYQMFLNDAWIILILITILIFIKDIKKIIKKWGENKNEE